MAKTIDYIIGIFFDCKILRIIIKNFYTVLKIVKLKKAYFDIYFKKCIKSNISTVLFIKQYELRVNFYSMIKINSNFF